MVVREARGSGFARFIEALALRLPVHVSGLRARVTNALLGSRVVMARSFRLRQRARGSGHYRVGEDAALADAACQRRRIRVGKRSCNLKGIARAHVATLENDPNTELRPKGVRL